MDRVLRFLVLMGGCAAPSALDLDRGAPLGDDPEALSAAFARNSFASDTRLLADTAARDLVRCYLREGTLPREPGADSCVLGEGEERLDLPVFARILDARRRTGERESLRVVSAARFLHPVRRAVCTVPFILRLNERRVPPVSTGGVECTDVPAGEAGDLLATWETDGAFDRAVLDFDQAARGTLRCLQHGLPPEQIGSDGSCRDGSVWTTPADDDDEGMGILGITRFVRAGSGYSTLAGQLAVDLPDGVSCHFELELVPTDEGSRPLMFLTGLACEDTAPAE